ncbi:MAG: hypothetical protein WC795_02765 [Candidatus Paceibacterota bacterium]|jgi:hypothetical protein
MNTAILDGTILATIVNFKGNFKEINPCESTFISEREIGEMTEVEKTILTIKSLQIDETKKIIEKIIGKNPEEAKSPKERRELFDLLDKKTSDEQKQELFRLRGETKALTDLMWTLIKLRIPAAYDAPSLELRPGYKIIGGISEDAAMHMMGLAVIM